MATAAFALARVGLVHAWRNRLVEPLAQTRASLRRSAQLALDHG